ncbi:hypothetical protein LSCM1_02120 [Leishmania martiniquensis]|uniref:Nuclear cap binding complex subunit CBP110 n=1 Tax=Leishmania martiniquensis TaxID=1580590 RepID=A0A836GZQ3_9TRYP|nr:hypothetical protein LSCM1_02120 [Leishmania martiniquensis]
MSSHNASMDTDGSHEESRLLLWQGAVQRSLWHLPFFPTLSPSKKTASAGTAHSSASPKAADDNVVSGALHSLALLEAVGYTEAGHAARQLRSAHASGSTSSLSEQLMSAEQQSWVDKLHVAVLRRAAALSSTRGSGGGALAIVLAEVEQQRKQGEQTSPCDALFSELAQDYLERIIATASAASRAQTAKLAASTESNPGVPQRCRTSIFQYDALPLQAGAAAALERPAAAARQQLHWYEARLYAALACSASASTPGPLARLLVAYAHQGDRRLQVATASILGRHLSEDHNGGAAKGSDTKASVTSVVTDPAAAALAPVRISGVVAGVLEHALCVARVRTAVTVAKLRAAAAVNAPLEQPPLCTATTLCAASHVPRSAALLLSLITEECGYYRQTCPVGTSNGNGQAAVTAAVLHAVQELLFTVALGSGTQHMHNRPEPPAAPKRLGAEGSGGASTMPVLIVTTTRGATLPEADAITQEFFPALVQQLGIEWVWSPLLLHLSSLDKVQVPAEAAGVQVGSAPASLMGVRWSSHALMDTILLSLAPRTYPQRLLNLLPGSYERLLSNLDLLPPMRPQVNDGGDAGQDNAAHRAGGPWLFSMPAYYAEPASALVAYFERAGVSGLRIEEAERILATATSVHPMVVRLRAQAPPRRDADGREDDAGHQSGGELDGNGCSGVAFLPHHQQRMKATPRAYALTHERVQHLISRYQGEVLLAAVVVHTQLRVPSHVQQLMRVLAPLFLKVQLAWRAHDDGSSASWLLQSRTRASVASTIPPTACFSAEAAVLLDDVGYEFYPLEWLPAALAASAGTKDAPVEPLTFPYSLLAAVGHQFELRLRGTPLGSSGDVTLRHPAGPRTSAVMPSVAAGAALLSSARGGEEETKVTAAAWRRTERFVTGLMQLCYLDSKTSSTELEGTLAVSSTRRVLTTSGGSATLSSRGGGHLVPGIHGSETNIVAAADVASHRLRSLLQQPAVMDAMWGAMEKTATTRSNGASLSGSQRREKRPRSVSTSAEAQEHLRSMQQLLQEYGAASFDTTVEAADFALMIAQAFLPLSTGTSASLSSVPGKAGAAASAGKKSDALLRAGLEWGAAVVGNTAIKAKIHMRLQQQQQQGGPSSFLAALAQAYNSATVDTAWLARSALRYVPQRIWEKLCTHRSELLVLARRHHKWVSRLRGNSPTASEAPLFDLGAAHRADPLLMEQWTQWERVLEQLGLSEHREGAAAAATGSMPHLSPGSVEDITCAQWLWYSPYFASEMTP